MLYGKCGGVGVCTCAGCLYESQGSHGTRKQMQLGHLAGLFVSSSVVSKPISLVLFVSSSVVSKPISLVLFVSSSAVSKPISLVLFVSSSAVNKPISLVCL